MPLIIIIALLCILRYLEVWRFAEISWWWIVGLMAFAFLWFEFIEKILGLDKKGTDNVDADRRKERLKDSFKKK